MTVAIRQFLSSPLLKIAPESIPVTPKILPCSNNINDAANPIMAPPISGLIQSMFSTIFVSLVNLI